ncbi:ras GTPase-activating-like protein rgaA [Schistocerca gregaria]|uniref:ras GTPase-activating-like protein rgaA n=1 Tax=Schistocerca gregaria TaxID=7010 RepID=UPI00211F440B|nr:ras GTPase-activating-like protein rgaA [Schistocerca gregaria]XP_049850345.1 ras GTPase-activating-like protein rgaA [Schistocerca gregaria]XP_049850346.1 ras GTPase-activating-like protein rgaA [Schistocerca gregaria]XP_049850348.1 ras GTPase-activating-like protein rgaA [Schistocerca gregaria]
MNRVDPSTAQKSEDHEASSKRIGNFQIGESLGRGAFGTVYKGLNFETGETVAIKRVKITGIPPGELVNIESELDLLRKLNHPNIVKYVGILRSDNYLNIVLEFVENGSLLSILKKFGNFPETLIAVYITQVLEGLAYLHGQGVIHRDIKASNLLTTKDGGVKVADFGVATISKPNRESENICDNVLGSPYWMAPEIIMMNKAQPSSDIWSLGCTIIELKTGEPPYYHMPQLSAMYHIAESEEMPFFPPNISDSLTDFLKKCFERDQEKRPSARALLSHPWIIASRTRLKKKEVIVNMHFSSGAAGIVNNLKGEQPSSAIDSSKLSNDVAVENKQPELELILHSKSSGELSVIDVLEDVIALQERLEELRQQVVIEFRNNQLLEADVKRLDKKIELLIRNRISLGEVIRSQKTSRLNRMCDDYGEQNSTNSTSNSTHWKTDALMEFYGMLFYLLQTNPKYLTSFIFFRFEGSEKFIQTLILTLFGFAFSAREEYLLLQLFHTAIQREIGNLTSINAFSEEASVLLSMIIAYNHRVQERDFLKSVFGECIKVVLQNKQWNFEIDPRKIYDQLLNEKEIETGIIMERLKPDMTDAQILENEEVDTICRDRVEQLLKVTDMFFKRIIESRDYFPYGLRHIMHLIKSALCSKFKDQENSINTLLCYIAYYRFMNPALIAPEDYEMADTLDMQQRVSLIAISKMLSNITNNRLLDGDASHIQKINAYIQEKNVEFRDFLTDVIRDVPESSEYFNISDKYLEYCQTTDPVIYISPNEMFLTHSYIYKQIDKITSGPNDALHKLISSMPKPPSIVVDDPSYESEIALTLKPVFDSEQSLLSASSTRLTKLYNNTKKMIVDIIKNSHKDSLANMNLFEVLTSPQVFGDSRLNQRVRKILSNLDKLQEKGMVSKDDNYNSILNDIQNDLAQRASVCSQLEKEIKQLMITLARLKERSVYLSNQLTAYNDYVKGCLEQSVLYKKKKSNSSRKKIVTKYSCGQLLKKGVIVQIEVPPSQHSVLSFEIEETNRPGVFSVSVFAAGIKVQTIPIELEDLLEKQYNGIYILDLMDGRVKLRINLLIHLLNKKMSNR